MIVIPNEICSSNICFHILFHDNGNSTGQLTILRDMGAGDLACAGRKKNIYIYPKSESLVLVPSLFIQIIKKAENNWTFPLQFVYQAWITDPKTALRQRRKEKKRSAREEQKRRRKGSGEGKCCVKAESTQQSLFLWPWATKGNYKGQTLLEEHHSHILRSMQSSTCPSLLMSDPWNK